MYRPNHYLFLSFAFFLPVRGAHEEQQIIHGLDDFLHGNLWCPNLATTCTMSLNIPYSIIQDGYVYMYIYIYIYNVIYNII